MHITGIRQVGDFHVGSVVRVRDDVSGQVSEPAVIGRFYTDIDGGLKLDREVFGFRSWNVADCELVQ